jgi:hypothetical protein
LSGFGLYVAAAFMPLRFLRLRQRPAKKNTKQRPTEPEFNLGWRTLRASQGTRRTKLQKQPQATQISTTKPFAQRFFLTPRLISYIMLTKK